MPVRLLLTIVVSASVVALGVIFGTAALDLPPGVSIKNVLGYPPAKIGDGNTTSGLSDRTPPRPYDISINGLNDTQGIPWILVPAGQWITTDIVITPKVAGLVGQVYVRPNLPQCGSLPANVTCTDPSGITVKLSSQSMSNLGDLKPIYIKMNVSVPMAANAGNYSYDLIVETKYTWPNGTVSNDGVIDLFNIAVSKVELTQSQSQDKLSYVGLYKGIESDNEGLAMLQNNRTYFILTLNQTMPYVTNDTILRFHNVLFSFNRPLITPGGAILDADVTFTDGSKEKLGVGELPIETDLSKYAAVTSLTQNTNPQAGLTIYRTPLEEKVKVLVSVDQTIDNSANLPHQTIYRPIRAEIEVCSSSQATLLASNAVDVNSNITSSQVKDSTTGGNSSSTDILRMQFPLKLPLSLDSTFPGYKLQALWSHDLGGGITLYYWNQPLCPSMLNQSQTDDANRRGLVIVLESWNPAQVGTSKEIGLKSFALMGGHMENSSNTNPSVRLVDINGYTAVGEESMQQDATNPTSSQAFVEYFNDNDMVWYHVGGGSSLDKIVAVARSIPK